MLGRLLRLLLLLVGTTVLVGLLPASAASAQAAPTSPRPAFGAQFHGMWTTYDDASRARYLDQLAASGAEWVRLDVSWAMLQPVSRDAYDLKWGVPFVDRVVTMATSRGLKPLVTLWLTPAWANAGAGPRVLPDDPADYAAAAGWAAARWAGQVPAWEVWNEPNHPDFMVGADPVAYTRLLQAAYPAIKTGSPAATVVFGGPSQNDSGWIAKTYAAGVRGSFDAMATHPYQAVADLHPEAPDEGNRYRFTHLAAVHRLMVTNGDGHKPIWATEFGWSSHANDGSEANWERGVTEAQQADYAVRALRLVAATMPYVTHMFWYADRDFAAGNVQNSNYGIFHNDLRPKPLYAALKAYLTSPVAAPRSPVAPAAAAPAVPAPAAPAAAAPAAPAAPAPAAPAAVAPAATRAPAVPAVTSSAPPVGPPTGLAAAAPRSGSTASAPLRRRSLIGTGSSPFRRAYLRRG